MTETVDDAPSACPSCPNCKSEYSYQVGDLKVCTECAHEWTVEANATGVATVIETVDGDGDGAEAAAVDAASVIRELKDRARQLTSGVVKKV